MASEQPIGIPLPSNGKIETPPEGYSRLLSAYIHVPFCRVRCGYCDFNTYSHEFGPGADISSYHQSVIKEIEFSTQVLKEAGYPHRKFSSVFFGGGTPTMLEPNSLTEILFALQNNFGLCEGAEVTIEANPDSVDKRALFTLRKAGFTRVSFGMQSSVPQVLSTLDRTHNPQRVPLVVQWAKEAGLDCSLDLIYGTPGETIEQWQESLETAISLQPDHISAYSLIIEQGTKMFRQIQRGELPAPKDDDQAEKYLLADNLLAKAGYQWYEISNWARSSGETSEDLLVEYPRFASHHNIAYWRGDDWWGYGPGAHSHILNTRWWNRKHPLAYAAEARKLQSPSAGHEILTLQDIQLENVMLKIRTVQGLHVDELENDVIGEIPSLIKEGLLEEKIFSKGRLVLTQKGRLLADSVTRRLT
ncbi:radical SAM family heme chaperone HemW [Actinomycetaceae bacterium TAE3-ERU4]|nr:radical SAM family heme chaperone HemW [Actinomycetaceae bacterium TAE3-ERU4]